MRSTFSDRALESLSKCSSESVEDTSTPSHRAAGFELDSAMKGQFTLSLREAQHFIRARLRCPESLLAYEHAVHTQSFLNHSTPSPAVATFAEQLIFAAQREILSWLQQTVHVPVRDAVGASRVIFSHDTSDQETAILELRRAPSSLLWQVDDAFSRLAIHCVARTFECPSFSRNVTAPSGDTIRTTCILHPNPLTRGTQTRRAMVRRPMHRRNSSTSTTASTGSVASSAAHAHVPAPITVGLLQHAVASIETPPSTEYELTDSADDLDDDGSAVIASDSDW